MRGTEKWKLGAKDCKNSGSKRGERKDMKDQGKTIGKYIHHHLFLQTVRAGSTSVTRVSSSRKPTFSSVSTLRRRLAGVFGSCCHHHLARRSTGFQGFLPALQVVKQYSKHRVGGVFRVSTDYSGQAARKDPKMFDSTKHGTLCCS